MLKVWSHVKPFGLLQCSHTHMVSIKPAQNLIYLPLINNINQSDQLGVYMAGMIGSNKRLTVSTLLLYTFAYLVHYNVRRP
jgi:hypothetical protein